MFKGWGGNPVIATSYAFLQLSCSPIQVTMEERGHQLSFMSSTYLPNVKSKFIHTLIVKTARMVDEQKSKQILLRCITMALPLFCQGVQDSANVNCYLLVHNQQGELKCLPKTRYTVISLFPHKVVLLKRLESQRKKIILIKDHFK